MGIRVLSLCFLFDNDDADDDDDDDDDDEDKNEKKEYKFFFCIKRCFSYLYLFAGITISINVESIALIVFLQPSLASSLVMVNSVYRSSFSIRYIGCGADST